MLKKALSIILFLILFCGVLPVSANNNSAYVPYKVNLWVDNQLVEDNVGYLTQHGNTLVPLQIVEMLGGSFHWAPEEQRITIQSQNRRLTMYIGNYQCANGARVEKMPTQPTIYQNTVMIPLRYTTEKLGAMVFWREQNTYISTTGEMPIYQEEEKQIPEENVQNPLKQVLKTKIVVLDPGHGGSDPGAVAGKIKEKDLNLQVSKILKEILVEAGVKVYMTRTEDEYVGLYTRAGIANNLKADLFVSIHHNASTNTGAQGVMTLYYPTTGKQAMNGQNLAGIVQKHLVEELKAKDWGIIPRPKLVVTRETRMPAVLAELGFMTNKAELNKLVTYEFQKQAAQALFNSIIEALQQ